MSAAPSRPMSVREYFSAQRELYSPDDAARIGPELERLAADGATKASEIVEAARPVEAPLHGYFEWNDLRAAEGFRQMQAARMARTIVVKAVRDGKPVEELAFRPSAIRIVRSEATTMPPRAGAAIPQGGTVAVGDRPDPSLETWRSEVQALHGRRGESRDDVPTDNPAPVRRLLVPFHERPVAAPPPRTFVPEPGHTVWKDAAHPSQPTLAASLGGGDVSKLPDDELINRAMARLLGFEDTYASQRKREAFEAIFSPVFMAIGMARKRAGLEGDPST